MVGVKRLVARRLPSHRYSMMGIRHCCSAVSDHYIRPTMIKLKRAVASWSVAWARCRDLRRLFRGTSVTLFNACLVLACYWKIFGYRIRTLLGESHPCGGFVGEAADLSHIRELIRFFSARSWTRGRDQRFSEGMSDGSFRIDHNPARDQEFAVDPAKRRRRPTTACRRFAWQRKAKEAAA